MIEVNAFLTAEGNSDYDFLPVLLERALNRLCLPHRLAVAPVQVLRVSVQGQESRHEAVCRVARAAVAGMTLLFYHYDGSAAPDREERKYWAPLWETWKRHGPVRPLVRVVPVREMESWALSDLDVLRQVAGSSWQAKSVFEGDRLSRVECLSDPKRTLKDIVASGRRRRRAGREAGDYLTRIAELMRLDYLENVPSYRLWLSETFEALKELRLIRD
ncbi:DUF4276 family protein [Actinomadura sp. ATCC 31491]|uniref:DUF4276 family protein n=1 Tax=Actinomadura luzonensis TaxID=2805427 RepID=A0ABT0FKI1_9ACTN|nr:DUF4276 family protein [Actinomadura luzonensis]MCK2212796.1 DUF4276 family protein [Actinomadura luzonensis]